MEDGPLMPLFLPPTDCRDDAKVDLFRVRYVLAKSGNLNKVIKNMRNCTTISCFSTANYTNKIFVYKYFSNSKHFFVMSRFWVSMGASDRLRK